MQICLETLEAHDDLPADKRREFIARCLSQSDRLRRLLADVATITSLDEGAADVAFTAVDLRSAITEVAELNLPVAEAKGFAVSVDVAAGITLHGNRPLLASVSRTLSTMLWPTATVRESPSAPRNTAKRYASRWPTMASAWPKSTCHTCSSASTAWTKAVRVPPVARGSVSQS